MMQSQARKVITIDGLSASGKSTLAKLLARKLGFVHVNTGLLYRAAAFLALKENLSEQQAAKLVSFLSQHSFRFDYSEETGSRLLIDDQDYSDLLQSQEVASFTSKIAAIPELREALRELQIQAFPSQPIVAEGRDLGTIIFPAATVKFFIVGDPLVRAERRAFEIKGELSEEKLKQRISEVAKELQERDERDSTRAIAPLKQAQDAILIDNSVNSLDETVEKMVKEVSIKI